MSGGDVKSLQGYLVKAGFKVSVDGQFGSGTFTAVKAFEARAAHAVDGVVDADDIETLRTLVATPAAPARAHGDPPTAPARLAPGLRATVGANGLAAAPAAAPDAVKKIIAAGNAIATKPYIYGGGHGKWIDAGYDCSGSVSYALHGAGLLAASMPSSGFISWGLAGPGPVGDALHEGEPHLHGRRGPALRHQRAQRARHPLAGRAAPDSRLRRPAPHGAVGGGRGRRGNLPPPRGRPVVTGRWP